MEIHPAAQDNIENNIEALAERRLVWQRQERLNRRERRNRWLRERAHEARSGFLTTLLVGRWAIHQAVRSEESSRVRKARENLLMRRWRRLAGDLAIIPYLGRNLFTA